MNKLHLIPIAALGALMLTGCAKSGVETSPESLSSIPASEQEIGFSTYTGRTVTKATAVLEEDFNVEAFLSGAGTRTLYFHPTSYTYSSGSYTGDIVRYWPLDKTQNLDFYAVSPLRYTDTSSEEMVLKPSADSTITLTGTDGTTDVVAARVLDAPNGDTPASVALHFGHKLTKVAFKAIGQDQTKKYVISDLILTANSTSTYSYEKATNPVTVESWSASSEPYDYDYVISDVTIAAGTSTSQAVGSAKYLIPSQASTLTATVSYKIYQTSDGTDKLIGDNSAGISVSLPTDSWGIDKSVVYNLKLGLTPLSTAAAFTADVTDWDSDMTVDQDVQVLVPVYAEGSYSGAAIKVAGLWWAPVNCGYDGTHPYGLLYQWGRTYGQGYDGETPEVVKTGYTSAFASHVDQDSSNKDRFYQSSDFENWYGGSDKDELWDTTGGSQESHTPTKSSWDPCPAGWRVPTYHEFNALFGGNTSGWTEVAGGQNGSYFNGSDSCTSETSGNKLFLPAGGFRNGDSGNSYSRGQCGGYWSSSVDDSRALCMTFSSGSAFTGFYYRAYGYSVRCVLE